jgi:hypothetical protein
MDLSTKFALGLLLSQPASLHNLQGRTQRIGPIGIRTFISRVLRMVHRSSDGQAALPAALE